MQILALERKIQEDQNTKLQKMQEEVTSLINKKVQ
jgi:septum formation topological specificity factor MinE